PTHRRPHPRAQRGPPGVRRRPADVRRRRRVPGRVRAPRLVQRLRTRPGGGRPRPGPSSAGAGGEPRVAGGHPPVVPVRVPCGGRRRRLSLGTGPLGVLTARSGPASKPCWGAFDLLDRSGGKALIGETSFEAWFRGSNASRWSTVEGTQT